MERFLKWTVRLLSGVMLLGIIGVCVIFYGIWHFGRDLPDYTYLEKYEPPIISRVYAGNGRLIGEFASEKRVFVPIKAIPKRIIQAFIAAEDQRFYSHSGMDFMGIARAAWSNLTSPTGRLVGASTITQQVAKNFLLTNERSYERKIKELILSSRIEKALTKDRILELYLNQIYLGSRSFGVAAAAQTYFGKSLDEVTVAEAAYLAALPKAPKNYHPIKRRAAALKRRNYVVGRMLLDGYITGEEAETAQAAPLEVVAKSEYISVGAEYFVEEVRRELLAKYGEKKMADGGYVVRSTLDPRLQQVADKALRNGLVAYDRRHGWRGPAANLKTGPKWLDDWKKRIAAVPLPKGYGDWPLALVVKVDSKAAEIAFADGKRGRIPLSELIWAKEIKPKGRLGRDIKRATQVLKVGDVVLVEAVAKDEKGKPYPADTYTLRQIPEVTGAIVAMDPHTGRVLAMTGGFSFWISQFNNATQAKRQPGSAFKPFVYLAGLDNGYTPSTIILDAPIVVKVEGLGTYKPQNFSKKFYGPTTMRRGLELSRNLMTLRLTQRIGAETVAAYGLQFGVSDHLPAHLAMALGAVETTPLRLTTAYAMLVNGGRKIKPTLIDRVQDRYGKTVFRHDARECVKCKDVEWNGQAVPVAPDLREQIGNPVSIYQVVSMMQGVVQRGTGAIVNDIGKPLAGKTGTTNNSFDAWFVGFSPDLVVGVWVGFDQPKTLGKREYGGKTAAPVFREFMMHALEGKAATPFRVPRGVVTMRVNLISGLPAKPGDQRIILEAFKPNTLPTPQGPYGPDGIQRPARQKNNPLTGTGGQY